VSKEGDAAYSIIKPNPVVVEISLSTRKNITSKSLQPQKLINYWKNIGHEEKKRYRA